MELALYTLINFYASIVALTSSRRISFFMFIIFILILSITIRYEVQGDILAAYVPAMSHTNMSTYILKEAFFWLSLRFIYDLLQDPYLVLIIIDLLLASLIFYSFHKIKVPSYAFFSFFTFFPTILFMQNVLRQWVATVIFIFAIGFLTSHSKKIFAFIISIFSHNSAIVALPLIYAQKNSARSLLYSLIIFLITLIPVYFLNTKSGTEHGFNFAPIYVLLFIILLLLYVFENRFKLSFQSAWLKILILSIFISLTYFLLLKSSASERISMMLFLLLYPFIVVQMDRYTPRFVLRLVIIWIGFLPIFLSEASKFILL